MLKKKKKTIGLVGRVLRFFKVALGHGPTKHCQEPPSLLRIG